MVTRRFAVPSLASMCGFAVAAGLVSYAPITCGCVDPWISIGLGVSGARPESPEILTADYISGNLFAKYYGKHVSVGKLPTATSISDCAATSAPSPSIRCRWWLWVAEGRKKGFDVSILTDEAGLFQSVEVVEIEYVSRWAP